MTGPDADVVVVGAGPAGSVIALLLARRGWRVIALDRARFPRTKACGECVNPGAVARLESLGLGADALDLSPVALRGWMLQTTGGLPHPAPFPSGVGPGWGIERRLLDAALVGAARAAGAEVREEVRVDGVDVGGSDGPRVVTSHGALRARLVVGADGLRSRVARAVARVEQGRAPPRVSQSVRARGIDLAPDRGRLVLDRLGTVGVAPVGDDLWNVTRVVPAGPDASVARTAREHLAAAATAVPELRGSVAAGELRASGPFHWTVSSPVARGVMLVGDAAGYFDPLTGQGIQRAVASAQAAAVTADRALGRGGIPTAAELAPYARRLRREQAPGRRLQGWIDRLLDHPRWLATALRRLDRAGTLPDVVAVTGDARSLASLVTLRHFRTHPSPLRWPE